MSESKIPKGPWWRSSQVTSFGGDVFLYGADRLTLARVFSPFADDGSDTRIAVADMMLAAPELYEALDSVSISGPDANGIIWLHVKSNGLQGMFNLGSDPTTLAMRALIGAFELRRVALLKASPEKNDGGAE